MLNQKLALVTLSLTLLLGGVSTIIGLYFIGDRHVNNDTSPAVLCETTPLPKLNVSEDVNNLKFEIIEKYKLINIIHKIFI